MSKPALQRELAHRACRHERFACAGSLKLAAPSHRSIVFYNSHISLFLARPRLNAQINLEVMNIGQLPAAMAAPFHTDPPRPDGRSHGGTHASA